MAMHRALLATTWPLLGPETVLSHVSAGILWGLPVSRTDLGRVHATAARDDGGRRTPNLHLHVRRLPAADLAVIEGYRVTGLARSAIDIARASSVPQALAVLDAAARLGVGVAELSGLLDQDARRHGVQGVRWALPHADARAESPAESISRYWMLVGGLPTPELQFEVRDAVGALLGRADFGWPELGVLGEFDGRIKYDDLLAPQEVAADVVMREKRRELGLRAHGWWVIRWTWQELQQGWGFVSWLRSALAAAPAKFPRAKRPPARD